MSLFLRALKFLKNYIDGNFAYENYLQHHRKNHPDQKPLDKKSFFTAQQKNKFSKINRCC
jgi:uncharacterized short protein YbdD (DUF466 family)